MTRKRGSVKEMVTDQEKSIKIPGTGRARTARPRSRADTGIRRRRGAWGRHQRGEQRVPRGQEEADRGNAGREEGGLNSAPLLGKQKLLIMLHVSRSLKSF